MASSRSSSFACEASAWPTGACLQVGASAAWGLIAASRLCRRCSRICGPRACSSRPRRCWSGSGWPARVHARKRMFHVLAEGLTDAAHDALEKLLTFDPAVRRSRFAWLRDCAESPAPANLLALRDRLEYVRGLGIDAARVRRIHPARLGQPLAEAAVMTVQHIADLEPARRTAVLVTQIAELEARLADATLAMSRSTSGRSSARRRTGMSGASKPPNAMSRKHCCCSAAPSRRSNRARMALRSWTARSGCSGWTTSCRSSAQPPRSRTRTFWSLQPSATRCFALPGRVPLRLKRAVRPGTGGDRGAEDDGPRRRPHLPQAPARRPSCPSRTLSVTAANRVAFRLRSQVLPSLISNYSEPAARK
jgi:hypothetical protein